MAMKVAVAVGFPANKYLKAAIFPRVENGIRVVDWIVKSIAFFVMSPLNVFVVE
jgi:hypothetical protein